MTGSDMGIYRKPLEPAWTSETGETMDCARERVRGALLEAARSLAEEDLPRPALDGKLLRPLMAYLTVPEGRRCELDQRFWVGLLAVEMVHEASLLHDDILDDADQRRGRPTMVASAGVGPALVQGDHLLTAAYRSAAATGSDTFLKIFILAVERTVAGEMAQERSQGQVLTQEEYRRIISGKSGELFRAAFSLAPSLLGTGRPEAIGELGSRLGCIYQMVDDFLDYCPGLDRGKPRLQDFRQEKWTWPLGLVGVDDFALSEEEILSRLFHRQGGIDAASPMEKGVGRVEAELQELCRRLEEEGMEFTAVQQVVRGWIESLRKAAGAELITEAAEAVEARKLAEDASRLRTKPQRIRYFSTHARSFRFASRLFPPEALNAVADIYVFCRFTDDLVDEAEEDDPRIVRERLQVWSTMVRKAYQGETSGVDLLEDIVVGLRGHDVPFHYVEELLRGVGMDVSPSPFSTMQELEVYTYRVAGVVGGWMVERFGVRHPWVLRRAYAMGHAMQLTNIARDVGEDLRRERLYLPLNLLEKHGVAAEALRAAALGEGPVPRGYSSVMEEIMAEAEAAYARAFQAIPSLPWFLQAPVAVAAGVYRGIHREIRRNGYDNLRARARVSLLRKVRLGIGAVIALALSYRPVPRCSCPAPSPGPESDPYRQEVVA